MTQSPPRILVVDDEEAILEFVSFNLEKEGYEVVCVAHGDEALTVASENEFDLVVLDIMLPGADGFEICKAIRERSAVPVLFLSARDTELDKVVGLEIGGDDYLAKPFGIRELLARVRALLRRSQGATTGGADVKATDRLAVGDLVLDEGSHLATFGKKTMDLTPREFELLACLMRHPGQVLSREQLLRQAWDWEYLVETKTVDTHVKRLRDKLEAVDADPQLVETVRGYGYRLAE